MFKIINHIILSGLLLLAVSGMTINMHFCNGHLYDLALISPAHDCCDIEGNEDDCHHHEDQHKSHQCDDETIKLEAENDFFVSNFSFDFESFHSFDLFFTTQLLIDDPLSDEFAVTGVINYKKPPPQDVVLAKIQSFLL